MAEKVEAPFKGEFVWLDGGIYPRNAVKALIPLDTSSLHYGTAPFEGIKCYNGSIFRLKEHLDRLFYSAGALRMGDGEVIFGLEKLGFITKQEVADAIELAIVANGFADGCYVRPIVFRGSGKMLGVNALKAPVHVAIMAEVWPTYISSMPAVLSGFRRLDPSTYDPEAKFSGAYLNGTLAKNEAAAVEGSEPLMLDTHGYLAEASGANLMVVRKDGSIDTPRSSSGILPGITRDTVLHFIAPSLRIRAREKDLSLTALFNRASEAFWVGTAAEVAELREVFVPAAVMHELTCSGRYLSRTFEKGEETGRKDVLVAAMIGRYMSLLDEDPAGVERLRKAGVDPERRIRELEKDIMVEGLMFKIGTNGENKTGVAERVGSTYRRMVSGEMEKYRSFLTKVNVEKARKALPPKLQAQLPK